MKTDLHINNGTSTDDIRNTASRFSTVFDIHVDAYNPGAIKSIPSRFNEVYASVNLPQPTLLNLPKHIKTIYFKGKITNDSVNAINKTMSAIISCNHIKEIRVKDKDESKLQVLETAVHNFYKKLFTDKGFPAPEISIIDGVIFLPEVPSLNVNQTPELSQSSLNSKLERIKIKLKSNKLYADISHHLTVDGWSKLTKLEKITFKKGKLPLTVIPWIVAQNKLIKTMNDDDYTSIEPYLERDNWSKLDKKTQGLLYNGIFEKGILQKLTPLDKNSPVPHDISVDDINSNEEDITVVPFIENRYSMFKPDEKADYCIDDNVVYLI